ncbi:MAG: Lipoate-protein ligase LplJ [Firmicutes bacterium ADurb.Bin193]|nr:MAG: Lipoate-protein ligase LplJ [Firmicutes bacterium ADurb.Bin193]
MKYINNESMNPYFNLALEEYFLKQTDMEVFILWRNDNTIVVGKSQNTAAEINTSYVKEHNISVVRRLTGGGAVYHDKGNLNFTFIVSNSGGWFSDFGRFTDPVIKVLRDLGVNAENSGRNDITVDGCKISGNAQTVYKNRILHHGTLLFSADISKIAGALNPHEVKISCKGIKSVKSRVTNISPHMNKKITVEEFKDLLAEIFGFEEYALNNDDIDKITRLEREKYSTWEWNFSFSPEYSFKNNMRFDGGCIEIHLDVKDGIIKNARIFGDFFGTGEIAEIERALVGVRHGAEDIKKALSAFDFNKYFLNISLDNFLELIQ